jgi:MFS transporter, ACS family, D-galactonate transporter
VERIRVLLQRRVVCEPENDAGNRRQIEDRAVGSVVETAASPLDGFNTGFMICGVIMLVGGVIGMMLMRPERETMRWASKMPEVAVGPG